MEQPPTLFALARLAVARKYKKGVVSGHIKLRDILPPSLLHQVVDCVEFSAQELCYIYCDCDYARRQHSFRWTYFLETILLPSEARRTDADTLRSRRDFGVPKYNPAELVVHRHV